MIELADIFRVHGGQYRKKFGRRMPRRHLEVMDAIEQCRTESMGGHVLECELCGEREYSFHSCSDRHCPKCGNAQSTEWLERQRDFLLPVPYYMVTFTLPDELRALARSRQKSLYSIMFRASSQAFKTLALDPRFLGGEVGMLGVLQTWAHDDEPTETLSGEDLPEHTILDALQRIPRCRHCGGPLLLLRRLDRRPRAPPMALLE